MTAAYVWIVMAVPSAPRDRPILPLIVDAQPLRIVAFGTSLTHANPWPELLQERLAACLVQPVEVVRISKSGSRTTWALENVSRVIAAKPDLVLLEFAINDADVTDGVSLRESVAQHNALIDALETSLPVGRIALMTMNPVNDIHRFIRVGLPRYYAAVATTAETRNTALIDLYADWVALPRELRQFPDGLHPTANDAVTVIVPGIMRRIAIASGTRC